MCTVAVKIYFLQMKGSLERGDVVYSSRRMSLKERFQTTGLVNLARRFQNELVKGLQVTMTCIVIQHFSGMLTKFP